MKTTYLIEYLKNHSVFNYYQRLSDAKNDLEVLPENEYRILVIRGPAYGEGWHDYQVTYSGSVFLKQKI